MIISLYLRIAYHYLLTKWYNYKKWRIARKLRKFTWCAKHHMSMNIAYDYETFKRETYCFKCENEFHDKFERERVAEEKKQLDKKNRFIKQYKELEKK